MAVRKADHAGSWYSADGRQLTRSLDDWLAQVPDNLGLGSGSGPSGLPIPGARAIIAPHAGYAYSGPAAAWAYKCLDLSGVKRIFILHPSHHQALSTAALPTVAAYRTPLSADPLPLDLDTIHHLSTSSSSSSSSARHQVRFTHMSQAIDEAEHSAEMQLPYLHRLLQQLYPERTPAQYPPLVPIMVGATSVAVEVALGKLLAPYVADPASNAFVISSDFCHWGSRFQYTYYVADAPSPALDPRVLPNNSSSSTSSNHHHYSSSTSGGGDGDGDGGGHHDDKVQQQQVLLHKHLSPGTQLRRTPPPSSGPSIYESIAHVDRACMCAIATGAHADFVDVLRATGNTVCGRHPIGVFMAAVEEVKRSGAAAAAAAEAEANEEGKDKNQKDGIFHFIRYERSSDCTSVRDSSVSYVSAYALL